MYEVEYEVGDQLPDASVETRADENLESELPEGNWETLDGGQTEGSFKAPPM